MRRVRVVSALVMTTSRSRATQHAIAAATAAKATAAEAAIEAYVMDPCARRRPTACRSCDTHLGRRRHIRPTLPPVLRSAEANPAASHTTPTAPRSAAATAADRYHRHPIRARARGGGAPAARHMRVGGCPAVTTAAATATAVAAAAAAATTTVRRAPVGCPVALARHRIRTARTGR